MASTAKRLFHSLMPSSERYISIHSAQITVNTKELEPIIVSLSLSVGFKATYQSSTFMVIGTAWAEALLKVSLGLWP